jgi:type IV secretory pathway VirD2 relaxase
LKNNKALKTAFEMKKATDAKFAEDGAAQLEWVYKNSEYYEGSVNQYPIYRIP